VSALQDGDQRFARHLPDGRSLAPDCETPGRGEGEFVSPATIPPRRQPTLCDNRNHLRRDAPVGHCPECGAVVNAGATLAACDEQKHAAARLRRTRFCVDCGAQLIA
jgi:hypothetical protein